MAAICPELVTAALNFQSINSFLSCPAEYGSARRFSPASRNWPTMLVSRPITSGTPCLAARAARYFLLMSPNGCSTKLTWTPGCACSNRGITVAIETWSKYQTVSSVVAVVLVSGAATDAALVLASAAAGPLVGAAGADWAAPGAEPGPQAVSST